MKKYGLIGFPLGHSFSAKFFAEKFAKEGLDARYDNYEMASVDGLRALIAADAELCGLNVTIPHKQAVLPLLDDLTPEARAIGAVNVIRIVRDCADGACNSSDGTCGSSDGTCGSSNATCGSSDGTCGSSDNTCSNSDGLRLVGCNSDVIGFTDSLRPLLQPHHQRALVLGTGGASRAVVAGLRSLGIEPTYVSRRPIEGGLTYDQLSPAVMAAHTVVVNCSPVGMYPKTDEAPAIPYEQLTPRHLLYDLVYNPLDTRFMQLGREQGAVVKNGLEMLHLQALAAWRMWENEEMKE